MTPLVLDANVAFTIVTAADGVRRLEGMESVGPALLWPEVRSALHVARWRGLLNDDDARRGLDRLDSAPIRERRHRRLGMEAWKIADELGWAKTYEAEYLALASLLDAPLATLDRRMLRAAERLGLGTHVFR